jgi:hypothetical protein
MVALCQKLLGLVCCYGQGAEVGIEVCGRGAKSEGLVRDFLTGIKEDRHGLYMIAHG